MRKVLLALIGLSLLLAAGCIKPEINDCETQAKEMIPDRVVLVKINSTNDTWSHEEVFNWLDNTEVKNADKVTYRAGSERGENINYYYSMGEDLFAKNHLSYTKQSVDKDGVILGDNSFAVDFVLKPLPKTRIDETVIVVGATQVVKTTQEFEIIDKEFSTCKWFE